MPAFNLTPLSNDETDKPVLQIPEFKKGIISTYE